MPTFNALYGRLVRASVKGKSEEELVREALQNPIGTPRLRELATRSTPTKTAMYR